MIFSNQLMLSDDQAVEASAASTNIIDLGATGIPYGDAAAVTRDVGRGAKIPFLVQVVEDFATCDSVKFAIRNADNASMSSATTVYESEAILVADLLAGKQIPLDVLPRDLTDRYLDCYYTVAGSNATTGAVTAGVVAAVQNNG